MTRRTSRRGRPYRPMPPRKVNWGARLLVMGVAFVIVAGFVILAVAR